MKTPLVDDILNSLAEMLPSGLKDMHSDARALLRSKLEKTLTEQGLVSRETFDIQQQVLRRTREKLEKLEEEVRALELENH